MRILALVPGGIGDQILFFPTLADLKQAKPSAQIDVVVEPRSLGAYRVSQAVHEVIPFDFKAVNSLADWSNLLGVMRDRNYDVVLSLGRNWAVGALLWLTGIPTRVGYAGAGSWFLTNPVPLNPNQYAAALYHDLLRGLKITSPCPDLEIALPKQDLAWAEAEQQRLALPNTGYVILHGGSSTLAKQKGVNRLYPVSGWQVILQDFQQKQPQLPIVVVQGPDDGEFVASLQGLVPQIKVTSPGDVGKLAAMIAGANLMLCTDSAPMHLAVAVKTYTLALFGPTDPARSLPKSDKVAAVQSPTSKMAAIDPHIVLKKIWGG